MFTKLSYLRDLIILLLCMLIISSEAVAGFVRLSGNFCNSDREP
ncbi:MAG TPA: hypothetical protein PL110_11625 [Candidatus Eremiobacteraeota bacterium]|nr:hypothetical protein [Candidatus Eremiobacteraeota bacterium]